MTNDQQAENGKQPPFEGPFPIPHSMGRWELGGPRQRRSKVTCLFASIPKQPATGYPEAEPEPQSCIGRRREQQWPPISSSQPKRCFLSTELLAFMHVWGRFSQGCGSAPNYLEIRSYQTHCLPLLPLWRMAIVVILTTAVPDACC